MAPLKGRTAALAKSTPYSVRHMADKMLGCIKNVHEVVSMSGTLRDITPEAYRTLRAIVKEYQNSYRLGQDMQLSENEKLANAVIMREKQTEYKKAILDPTKFPPGYHIFDMLENIKQSQLFHMLKKMPKGGVLHAHDTALCKTEFLIQLTFRENLWICTKDEGCNAIAFRFSKEKPSTPTMEPCAWEPMKDFRERRGEENVRKYLLRRFSMYPLTRFKSNNDAWAHFMGIFILLDGLLTYAPVWADYYSNALKEFHEDGVQYLELRSVLPELYCIGGDKLDIRDTVQIYKDETERFMAEHPDFIGTRLIYAPLRGVEPKVVDDYSKTCTALIKEFPTFLVGFDLVGQEELGRPLIEFIEQLLQMPDEINFYFHAGETVWYGSSIDENLIDAILLGTKRIGHGYAITKHPFLMKLAKLLNIAIEVCPISNQVLQLGQDYRDHPAAHMIAQSVPIVISSDDPSFWRASPLSHDFYIAFLGIAPMTADLKFLKRISQNSITYSALKADDLTTAMQKWKNQWDKWIEEIIKNKDKK